MRERVIEALQHAAGMFINTISNRRSMITVTSVKLDPKGAHADIFVSVYPEKDTAAATDFLNRNRAEFREYVKERVRMRAVPHVTFLADPVIGGTIEPLS